MPIGIYALEQNQNSHTQMESLQGGFYFHPSDEDLSPGTPEWKKPLGGRAIGYSYSGSAVDCANTCFAAARLLISDS